MNSKYHILWIDDEWDVMTSFKKHCLFEYQMELHPFKTQKEGLDDYAKHPDFYEGGLGIGPNPQSPKPKPQTIFFYLRLLKL